MPLPLIIILSVLALLVFLLFFRFKVQIDYDGDFHYRVKLLFFTYRIKNKNEGKNKQKHEKKKKKSGKTKPKPGAAFKIDINNIERFLDIFKEIWEKTSPLLEKLRKGILIDNFILDLTVGGDDAAITAITYGTVCAVVYPVEALLEDLVRVRNKKLNIKTDFNGENSSLGFYVSAGIRLGKALLIGIVGTTKVLVILSKESKKTKGDLKNERASNTKPDGHNLAKNS